MRSWWLLCLVVLALAWGITPSEASCTLGGTNNGGYCKTGTTTQVSADIQVPTVAYNSPGSNTPVMSEWIGIGDISNATLIQAGLITEADSNGAIQLVAFYELLPASLHQITSGCVGDTTCKLHVFDVVSWDIHCLTNCTASNVSTTWSVTATNCGTAGPGCASPLWTWDITSAVGTITYADSLATGQWVVEDNPNVFRYPYFGKVVFQNAKWNTGNPSFNYTTDAEPSQDGNAKWNNYGPQNSTTNGFNMCLGDVFFLCDSNTYFGKDKGGRFNQ